MDLSKTTIFIICLASSAANAVAGDEIVNRGQGFSAPVVSGAHIVLSTIGGTWAAVLAPIPIVGFADAVKSMSDGAAVAGAASCPLIDNAVVQAGTTSVVLLGGGLKGFPVRVPARVSVHLGLP